MSLKSEPSNSQGFALGRMCESNTRAPVRSHWREASQPPRGRINPHKRREPLIFSANRLSQNSLALIRWSSSDAMQAEGESGTKKKSRRRSRSKSVVRAKKNRLKRRRENLASWLPAEDPSPRPATKHVAVRDKDRHRELTSFERHVAVQNLVDPEERGTFFSALRRPLPIAIRIRSPSPSIVAEWDRLRKSLSSSSSSSLDSSSHRRGLIIHEIPGIAGGWQIQNLPPPDVMKADPSLRPLRHFLSSKTAEGSVLRQEFVSMLPVKMLDIKSHHIVLDMCASPGSKTSQAIDNLYDDVDLESTTTSPPTSVKPPRGLVVANDTDPKRSYVLANRIKRTGIRAVSAAVVCHDATKFPNVSAPLRRRIDSQIASSSPIDAAHPYSPGAYDRIICDVPCSGDGTIRKDRKVFRVWHPGYGLDLHPLQLRIAMRGIALLKKGGYMTYSTCSFNHIENEAVVAELLKRFGTAIEVVEPSSYLQGIKYRQGLTSWKVVDDDFTDFTSFESPSADKEVDQPTSSLIPPKSAFPPSDTSIQAQLTRCVRMFPHDNDTGGFFIALLHKKSEVKRPGWLGEPSKSGRPRTRTASTLPSCHVFRPLKVAEGDYLRHFNRSSNESDVKKTFGLSPSLAQHIFESHGAAKLNIVSAGKAFPS